MADRLVSDCQAATVEASSGWPPERRAACVALLEAAARRIEEAITIWEGALSEPDESGIPFTAVVHIGAERARSLQRLYFDQKALAAELTKQTGVVWRDALAMDGSIAIMQPYDQFGAEESLHERANRAIATMRARAEGLAETIAAF
ncbi:MAG: hypothetical protein OXC65_03580 [Thiotrichales bacterium]|nr:hypothetical protein [Thiotrichales bacterium]MCY4284406.1 hypothetical protein [Thiotrichales bacterium]